MGRLYRCNCLSLIVCFSLVSSICLPLRIVCRAPSRALYVRLKEVQMAAGTRKAHERLLAPNHVIGVRQVRVLLPFLARASPMRGDHSVRRKKQLERAGAYTQRNSQKSVPKYSCYVKALWRVLLRMRAYEDGSAKDDALGNAHDAIGPPMDCRIKEMIHSLFKGGEHENTFFHLCHTKARDAQDLSLCVQVGRRACVSKSMYAVIDVVELRSSCVHIQDINLRMYINIHIHTYVYICIYVLPHNA